MTAKLQIGIVGRDGRLGSAAASWIEQAPDLALIGAVGPGEDWGALASADVVLEVTRAGLGLPHGLRLLEMGLRPLIGTSGVDPEQTELLNQLARERGAGGVVIPNFSIGMMAMRRALSAMGGLISESAIAEAHRAGKADNPSGTAKELCRLLDVPEGEVTSVRIDGLTAAHEARLKVCGDELVLRHESLGMESFKGGLLASLRYAATAQGVASGLEVVLPEACKLQPVP